MDNTCSVKTQKLFRFPKEEHEHGMGLPGNKLCNYCKLNSMQISNMTCLQGYNQVMSTAIILCILLFYII